jgi:hypothetical protein
MNLKQLGTIVVKRVFFAAGLRVERAKTPAFGWDAFFHRLKARGFHPKTVIDVGVAWGTPDRLSNADCSRMFSANSCAYVH